MKGQSCACYLYKKSKPRLPHGPRRIGGGARYLILSSVHDRYTCIDIIPTLLSLTSAIFVSRISTRELVGSALANNTLPWVTSAFESGIAFGAKERKETTRTCAPGISPHDHPSPSPTVMTNAASSIASSASRSQPRLHQLTAQMGGINGSNFTAEAVPQAPEDPLFGLMAAYRRDDNENKVDLGIGAYRDNNAKPWVLPVVRKVRRDIQYSDGRLCCHSSYPCS